MSSQEDQMGARHGLAAVRPAEWDWGTVIGHMARGDTAALGTLYDAMAPTVYGLALRILGDRGAAEEVTADTFVQCRRQATSYDPARGGPLAWLLMLARSRALDRRRAEGLGRPGAEPIRAALDVPSSDPGPEEDAAVAERRRCVRGAMARLGPDQRQVL